MAAPVEAPRGRTVRVAPGDLVAPAGAEAGARVTATPLAGGEPVVLDLDGSGALEASALPSLGPWALAWGAGGGAARRSVELVGAHMFELGEMEAAARAEGEEPGGDEAARVRARAEATQLIERACGRSFVPRRGVALVRPASRVAELPWRDVSAVEVECPGLGAVRAPLISDCQLGVPPLPEGAELRVVADYGLAEPPDEVRRAAIRLALWLLRRPAHAGNAVGESTDYGFVRYSLAGRDGATGLVEVDAAIRAWSLRGPAVA